MGVPLPSARRFWDATMQKAWLFLIFTGFWSCFVNASEHLYLGKKVNFVAPDGFCAVGGSQGEKNILDSHRSRSPNRLIDIFADCSALERIKNGDKDVLLTHYVTVSILKIQGKEMLVPISRGQFILDSTKNEYPAKDFQTVLKKAQQSDPRVGRATYLGLLGSDKNAVYRGIVSVVKTQESDELELLSVVVVQT